MSNQRYYTYRYAYPQGFIADDGTDLSGVVFYVGKATISRSMSRFKAHEYEARRGCVCPKCVVIRSVWDRGLQPDTAKMLETDNEYEALNHETLSIRETYAGPYLTNRILNPSYKDESLFVESETEWHEVLDVENGTVALGKHWITSIGLCEGVLFCVKPYFEGKPFSSRERLIWDTFGVSAFLKVHDIPLVGWTKTKRIDPQQRKRDIESYR